MQKKYLTKSNTFIIKTLNSLGIEGNFFNLTRPISYLMVKDEMLSTSDEH